MGGAQLGKPAAVTPAPSHEPFQETDWAAERAHREACDRIAAGLQWRVSVALDDGTVREFYLVGPHAEVQRRAQNFFRHPAIISFEPSGFVGDEVIDRRLNPIVTRSLL